MYRFTIRNVCEVCSNSSLGLLLNYLIICYSFLSSFQSVFKHTCYVCNYNIRKCCSREEYSTVEQNRLQQAGLFSDPGTTNISHLCAPPCLWIQQAHTLKKIAISC